MKINFEIIDDNKWIVDELESERKKQNRPTIDNMIETILIDYFENGPKKKGVSQRITIDLKSKELFETFRKDYPGIKRGLDVEFLNLIKKFKKEYKDICLILSSCLEKQKEQRSKIKGFVPGWPNLKTYINNNGWEIEYKETQFESKKFVQEKESFIYPGKINFGRSNKIQKIGDII